MSDYCHHGSAKDFCGECNLEKGIEDRDEQLQAATTRIAELEGLLTNMMQSRDHERNNVAVEHGYRAIAEAKLSEALAKISRYENQDIVAYKKVPFAGTPYLEWNEETHAARRDYPKEIIPLIAKPS